MKRICIYLTYDKQKIVDNYIGYMLHELKSCVDYLAVVCNQESIVCGVNILEAYADEIFYRENRGFDAGGYKDALCDFLGWDKVLAFDELVLVNDSMFGPFKPMKDIFAEMEEKKVDFWGLTKHGEAKSDGISYIPAHIQSYFLAIGSKLLHSRVFRDYWEDMRYYETFHDTVLNHELKFTQHFVSLGYSYDILADTAINNSSKIENNFSQYETLSYELIRKRNFPFLKKKQVSIYALERQTQENLRQAIDYIDKETDYDVSLIWENLIRTMYMTDLQKTLHLQYIIPSGECEVSPCRVLLAVFAKYPVSAEYVTDYLGDLKKDCTIKIFVSDSECFETYRKAGFDCRMLGEEDGTNLCGDFCEYDFVCVLHDADTSSNVKPSYVGKSYFYNIWENLIKCKNHIRGILKLFEDEPFLGFLAVPQPNFEEYLGQYGKAWDGKFKDVLKAIQTMDLHCQISEHKAPFCITDNFWIRGSILRKLKTITDWQIPCLNYLWIYLAQDAGYYSGIVESTDYASMNEVNLQYYLTKTAYEIREKYGDFHTFAEMKDRLAYRAMQEFCDRYPRIFVYGVGGVAKKYHDWIPDIEGYIVSDGQKKPDEIDGIAVQYLSELPVSDEIGIILCLNEENQMQVIPLLEKHGLEQYFCV